jgi:hypothetical protein
MKSISLLALLLSALFFGGIVCLASLIWQPSVWLRFQADSIMGMRPSRLEQVVAYSIALGFKTLPLTTAVAIGGGWLAYWRSAYSVALALAGLPLLNGLIPLLLFIMQLLILPRR